MDTHVLWVGPDDHERQYALATLRSAGYGVTTCDDQDEAAACLCREDFDFVVGSSGLGETTGRDLLRIVRELSAETEFIACATGSDLKTFAAWIRAGAADCLVRCNDGQELLGVVANLAKRRLSRGDMSTYEACRVVLHTDDHRALPKLIVDTAVRMLHADEGSLMVPDAFGRLHISYASRLPPEIQAKTRIRPGEGIAGRLVQRRMAAMLPDGCRTDPRLSDIPVDGRVRSSIVYPLWSSERLVGVLSLNRMENEPPFRTGDMKRASLFASHAVLALQNVRMLQDMVETERLTGIGRLAAGIAHDMKASISNIRYDVTEVSRYLETLHRTDDGLLAASDSVSGVETSTASDRCDSVQTALKTLASTDEKVMYLDGMVTDMLMLAQPGFGLPCPCELNDVIRSAHRIAQTELRQHTHVTFHLGDSTKFNGSHGRMCQVFVNLLTNAAHACVRDSKERNEIIVTSFREDARVVAKVTDSGVGIAPENLMRVFQPFFSTKGPGRGFGLGLAICEQTVHMHGGEIDVESTWGSGTTFTVRLPAKVTI